MSQLCQEDLSPTLILSLWKILRPDDEVFKMTDALDTVIITEQTITE